MNPRRRRLAGLITLWAVATLALTACGGGSSLPEPQPLTDLSHPAYAMKVLWHTDAGDGAGKYISGFQPAVADGRVYVANQGGKVVALSLADGKQIWAQDTGKALVSGPTEAAGTLLIGTRNGELLALSAEDGQQQWSADLPSEMIVPAAGNADTVIARTVDGHISALDRASGKRLWTIESGNRPKLTIRGTASPVIHGDTVYIGLDAGKLLAVDLQTGEQRWSQTVSLPSGASELDRIADIDADPLVIGDVIYVASAGQTLAALSTHGGQFLWQKPFSSVSDLAVANGHVYAVDMEGLVVAASRDIGGLLWIQDALAHRKPSAPAVLDGHIIVGDFEGYLHLLSPQNGSVLGRGHPFSDAIRAQPVVVGDRAIVLSTSGEVAAVRFTPSGR
jgi:outer membrane protein assembly factor BamB